MLEKAEWYQNISRLYGTKVLFSDDKEYWEEGILEYCHCEKEMLFIEKHGKIWKYIKDIPDKSTERGQI